MSDGSLGRLFHYLAEVDYSLRHIAGNENFLPDFLSRVASVDCIQLQTDLTEFNSVIDWVTEQNKDAEIVCIKQLLSKGEQPWSEEQVSSRWSRERKRLYVFNDILYNENRIVVPSHMIKTVLFQHHDTVFAGHRGAETTLESLKTRFYWNFMPADVTAYCSSCEKCQIFNYSQLINRAPLKSIVTVRPWQIVGLDYMGPFKRTTRGNIYVIIGVDHFTKFVTGAATATFSAEVTADFLFREIVCKFGMLEKLLSDQGSNFEAQTFKNLCALIGTDKIRTTTYHAPGNGITERVNKNVKPYLAKFVNTNHDDWDQFMPLVINAYNNYFHSTIGMTPYEALFGRPSVKVADVILNNQLPSGTVTNDISEFVLRLRRASENLNKIISENTAAAKIQQKESYDRFVQNKTQFRIGDSVKITNFSKPIGSVSAFVPKFLGPYTISSIDENQLVFTLESPSLATQKVHYNRLSHYQIRPGVVSVIPEGSMPFIASLPDVSIQSQIEDEFDLDEVLNSATEKNAKRVQKLREKQIRLEAEKAAAAVAKAIRDEEHRRAYQQRIEDTIGRVAGFQVTNEVVNLEELFLETPVVAIQAVAATGQIPIVDNTQLVQRYNEKSKELALCTGCGLWFEKKTGMRIHLMACKGALPEAEAID